MSPILLNDKDFHFSTQDLPCLIHGKPHEGSSLFTMSIVAHMYEQGEKLLVLCGYPMAQEEFLKQVGEETLPDSRAIFLLKEENNRFVEQVELLPDIRERIIFVKNIELFGWEIFEAVKGFNKIVLSGNLDECVFREELLSLPFKTKIYFSKPNESEEVSFPSLPKFSGYFVQHELSGIVRVQQ